MKKYKVFRTKKFKEEEENLSKEEQDRIEKIFEQLTMNPYVGDQLQIKSLREKRLTSKRIYYLVFEDLESVLTIALSDKKNQQKMIDFIRDNVNDYREILKKLLRKED